MNIKLAVLGICLVVFVGLGAAVIWHNPWVEAADMAVLQTAIGARNSGLTEVMKSVTLLGTGLVYLIVLAAGTLWPKHKGTHYVLIALASIALAQLVRLAVNLLVRRPRPPQSGWLVHATWYSFPSGHTVLAGTGFGLAAWLIWLADKRAGVVAAVVAVVLTGLVAASRVYLGVHWASDVVASGFFALFWIMLTLVIVERLALG